ncbi:MAG: hypothetical protein H7066_18520 [Cytophagaceae bacterium]|nr:hypothetical protein [Gemmatimonadaceae bacterium]
MSASKKKSKAKNKPKSKKHPTSRQTSLAEMRKEVLDHFVAKARQPLTSSGQAALTAMFDITLKRFKRSAAAKAPGLDIWTTKKGKFRTFILNEARKIANVASSDAGSGSIDAQVLNGAGLKVMLKTNANCQVAVSDGKLILDGSQFHGPVCSGFLEQQAV